VKRTNGRKKERTEVEARTDPRTRRGGLPQTLVAEIAPLDSAFRARIEDTGTRTVSNVPIHFHLGALDLSPTHTKV
jgi:hypothetical protein